MFAAILQGRDGPLLGVAEPVCAETSEPGPQERPEKVVEAEAGSPVVDLDHEQVARYQLLKQPFGVGIPGHRRAQAGVEILRGRRWWS